MYKLMKLYILVACIIEKASLYTTFVSAVSYIKPHSKDEKRRTKVDERLTTTFIELTLNDSRATLNLFPFDRGRQKIVVQTFAC